MKKRQKIEFSNLKYLFFSGIFLSGTPLPPLTKSHPAQKPLAERGVHPPPINGKNPLSSFWKVPLLPESRFLTNTAKCRPAQAKDSKRWASGCWKCNSMQIKGLGGALNRPKIWKHGKSAYPRIQCAFFQICKFAFFAQWTSCAKTKTHMPIWKNLHGRPTLEHIHFSAKDVKKGFAAQRQNMPEQQQVYCTW